MGVSKRERRARGTGRQTSEAVTIVSVSRHDDDEEQQQRVNVCDKRHAQDTVRRERGCGGIWSVRRASLMAACLSEQERGMLRAMLRAHTCGELVAGQKPITIPADATVAEACDILARNGILSALLEHPEGSGLTGFAGYFSYRSLLYWFLKRHPAYSDEGGSSEMPHSAMDLREVIAQAGASDTKAVDYCAERGKESKVLLPSDSLGKAVLLFGEGLHRCSVVENDCVLGTLSQSLTLRFIANHSAEVRPALLHTLAEFGLGESRAIVLEQRKNVIEGMHIMQKNKLSALAVVDQNGRLVGNLSLSDIKYIFRTRSYSMLWYTAQNFIKILRERAALEENAGMDTFPFFDISRERTLEIAIQKMIATRVHHLWVVDTAGVPIGVVSITDIMRVLSVDIE
ncbi:Protein SDS23 [Porphyridium purpureum]|uniref:Protein SDS23 n=1 Tax=Porphyridium purpureum TaxID=35688 RepID=A0A5J4Z4G4_PORPP|nr:Protein SDS23 [Porphyridium purpureum]|eukprot:POR4008..scf295_1